MMSSFDMSEGNLENLVRILNCFYLEGLKINLQKSHVLGVEVPYEDVRHGASLSGCEINLQKSHVLGVGVPYEDVRHGASLIGCDVMRTPFKYIGVTVGDFMSRNSAWVNVIQKIQSRLSKWKSKTLSVGGRLTLVKSVLGAAPLYYMSIYKVPKGVLHELESIRSKFFNGIDPLERKITWIAWENVLASKKNEDTWILDSPLSVRFPRLFALDSDKQVSVASKWVASRFNASFRREIRDGVERQQWTDMLSIL
nr:RNA-directed DNA polymerase, eukaryota [Tanacetum cinerariifolium]